MKADELWEKYANELLGAQRVMNKPDFLAALAKYGQAVRDRDAEICEHQSYRHPSDIAADISREPLP